MLALKLQLKQLQTEMNNQSPIKTLATLIRKTLIYNLEKSFYNW